MIKTTATPKNNTYNLTIPNNYVGKKIEILFYALDEITDDKNINPKKTMADFCGVISDADYKLLKQSTQKARKQWSRSI